MNKQLTLILLSTLFLSVADAQTKTLKTSVYFKTDKSDLVSKQAMILDTLIEFLADKDIQRIIVKGNTDSDADSVYNLKLSERRVLTVRKYLEDKSCNPKLFQTASLGEAVPIAPNIVDEGKQKNRRVDVIVVYKNRVIAEIKKAPEPEVKSEVKDTCSRDTLIDLPQGSSYLINICDYWKFKDCISITEYITPESIINSSFTTETDNGQQLATGGMFDIKICDNQQLTYPIKLRVPIPNNGEPGGSAGVCGDPDFRKMSLWSGDEHGRWGKSERLPIIRSNNRLFYEIPVRRSGRSNCDRPLPPVKKEPLKRTRIKAENNVRLLKVKILFPNPQTLYTKVPKNKRNKVKFAFPECPGACRCILVKAEAISASGDTLVVSKCLEEFKNTSTLGKCKGPRGPKAEKDYMMGFIPVRKKAIHRKYVIREEDSGCKRQCPENKRAFKIKFN